MSIIDKYESSEHRNNIAHFASIVNMAAINGTLNPDEENIIKHFSDKLNITEEEYKIILKDPKKYPLIPMNSQEERLERLYDLFRIIYADYQIENEELNLIQRYAIGLGFSGEKAQEVIQRSIRIFGGKIDFEDYRYLISNK